MWNQSAVDKWYEENLKSGVSKSKLDAIVQQQQADYLVRQDVPSSELQTTPIGLRAQTQEVAGGKYKPSLSAEEEKAELKMETLSSSLDVLEKNLKQIEVRGPMAGRLGWLSRISGGAIYPEVSDYEALRKGLIGPVARAISGEVGVLTDKDIARAENLLPKVTDTPELTKRKLNNLRELIAKRTKGEEVEIPEIEEESVPEEAGGAAPSWAGALPFLGYGAGAATGVPFLGPAALVGGMKTKRFLGGERPTGLEKILPGVPIPTTGEEAIAGGGAAAFEALFRGLGLLRGLKGRFGGAREAAATEAQKETGGISSKKLVKTVKDFFGRHPEAETPANKRLLEGLEKQKTISIPDLVKRTQTWNDAYAKAGGVKSGIKNKIYNELARTAKGMIQEVAPEVTKQTARLKFLYQTPRTLGKTTWQLGKIGAGVGGLGYLGRLLGLY